MVCNVHICATPSRVRALGAYVHKVFDGAVEEFIACSKEECRRRFGSGIEQQKTVDERAMSFGAGHAVLLLSPLGSKTPIGLVSTTTQRAGQGLVAKTSYLCDGVYELVTHLVDARLYDVAMPILGAGHGRIDPALAFVTLVLALAEAVRCAPGGRPLRMVTIIVFQGDPKSPPQVHETVVRRALALIGSPDQ